MYFAFLKVLILSHGNARVEAGLSINDHMLLPNMLAEASVTQTIVYEAVQKAGGPIKAGITPELMKMVMNSHRTYTHAQKEKNNKVMPKNVLWKKEGYCKSSRCYCK